MYSEIRISDQFLSELGGGGGRRKELEINLNKFKKNNVTLNKFYISNNVTT